jgi:hypothetical protein
MYSPETKETPLLVQRNSTLTDRTQLTLNPKHTKLTGGKDVKLIQQDTQCTYKATLRGVRVTIVAVEK